MDPNQVVQTKSGSDHSNILKPDPNMFIKNGSGSGQDSWIRRCGYYYYRSAWVSSFMEFSGISHFHSFLSLNGEQSLKTDIFLGPKLFYEPDCPSNTQSLIHSVTDVTLFFGWPMPQQISFAQKNPIEGWETLINDMRK